MVYLNSDDLQNTSGKFLIDTGSTINIVKESALRNGKYIDRERTYAVTGITNEIVRTYGQTLIKLNNKAQNFQIVRDDFPINCDGILGSEFFNSNKAVISFQERAMIVGGRKIPFYEDLIELPPRSRQLVQVRVSNKALTQGYLPPLTLGEGIFAGNALVKCEKGLALIFAINTTDELIKIARPNVQRWEVQEVEEIQGDWDLDILSKESPKEEQQKAKVARVSARECTADRFREIMSKVDTEGLNREELEHVENLVAEYQDNFHLEGEKLGHTNIVSHIVETTDDVPVKCKAQYRFAPVQREEIKKQVSQLLENDIIEPSRSSYSSPVWIVPKKPGPDGEKRYRMVIDFRQLNLKTKSDNFPLENVNTLLDCLGGAKYFSTFDLAAGFHQIPLDPSTKHKTAFATMDGLYEFNRLPFGLKTSPACFSRMMNHVLAGLTYVECLVYMDDIILFARDLEEHRKRFKRLMQRLREANLVLQPEKCQFLKKDVIYLGHQISENSVKPDARKLESLKKYPVPKDQKKLKSFLGLV